MENVKAEAKPRPPYVPPQPPPEPDWIPPAQQIAAVEALMRNNDLGLTPAMLDAARAQMPRLAIPASPGIGLTLVGYLPPIGRISSQKRTWAWLQFFLEGAWNRELRDGILQENRVTPTAGDWPDPGFRWEAMNVTDHIGNTPANVEQAIASMQATDRFPGLPHAGVLWAALLHEGWNRNRQRGKRPGVWAPGWRTYEGAHCVALDWHHEGRTHLASWPRRRPLRGYAVPTFVPLETA